MRSRAHESRGRAARPPASATLEAPQWLRQRGCRRGTPRFVAGQVGWNAEQQFESRDFVAQVRQALENVVAVVSEAGGTPAHIARLSWFITDKREYLSRLPEIGQAYRSVMGKHFPAMTMVEVSALMEDEAKVEIEASAVVPHV